MDWNQCIIDADNRYPSFKFVLEINLLLGKPLYTKYVKINLGMYVVFFVNIFHALLRLLDCAK